MRSTPPCEPLAAANVSATPCIPASLWLVCSVDDAAVCSPALWLLVVASVCSVDVATDACPASRLDPVTSVCCLRVCRGCAYCLRLRLLGIAWTTATWLLGGSVVVRLGFCRYLEPRPVCLVRAVYWSPAGSANGVHGKCCGCVGGSNFELGLCYIQYS